MELGRIQGAAYALPDPITEELIDASDAPGSAATVASRVFALELAALRETWRTFDAESMQRPVTALGKAKRLPLANSRHDLPASPSWRRSPPP